MRLLLASAVLIALAGCASDPTRYERVYCVQPSDLPTPQQCAGKAKATNKQLALCEPPKVKDRLTGDASKDVGILAGSALRLRAWGEGLDQVLEGCREPAQ